MDKFKIFYIVSGILSLLLPSTQAVTSSVVETALRNILVEKLPDCSVVLFEDDNYPDQNIIPTILNHLSTSILIDKFILNIQPSKNESETLPNHFEKVPSYRKERTFCTAVILLVSELKNGGDALYQMLKKFKSLIKKDEDFFIFVTQSDQIDQVLSSKPLAMGLKYKIGLSENTQTSALIAKSSCFHCKAGGPSVSEINLNIPVTELFKNQMVNLHGTTLRISTPISTRWLNEMKATPDPDGHWRPKRGPYARVLNLLEDRLNFTSYQFPSTGGGTGGIVNGTWVGTVGDVIYDKADIGHVTAETWNRHKVVAHSFPISYEWLTFSTTVPKPYFSWKAIYRPLATSVWPFVGGSIIIAIVFFFLLMKKDLYKGKKPVRLFMISDYVLATLLEQDSHSPEKELLKLGYQPSHSLRIFTIFWLMYTLLIATAYRSKLVTFLAFPNAEQPPESFQALADSHYELGLQYIKGAAYHVLKNSKNPTYSKIFKRMKLIEVDVDCFEKAIVSGFACISWDSIAEFVKHRNLTDAFGRSPVVKSPSSTLSITAGVVTEKRAIFKKEMDDIIHWITDTGVLKKLRLLDFQWIREQRNKWLTETNQTRKDYSQHSESDDVLTISHLSGSFYILILGFVFSIGIFLSEKLLHCFRPSNVSQPNDKNDIGLVTFVVNQPESSMESADASFSVIRNP